VAIGNARNAGLLAVRILATSDPALQTKMTEFQRTMADTVRAKDEKARSEFS
jgi:5-(carboxyamino)imidazole ribonucleotide mutase